MKRRSFIKSAATAGLGSMMLTGARCIQEHEMETLSNGQKMQAAAMHTLENIGVQLYTLRSLMEEDFEGTIERIAAIGYSEAEFAGYFDRPAADVRALLDRVEMTAPAAHVGIDLLRDNLVGVLDAASIIGHKYIVCPYLADDERTLDHYRRHATFFNEVGTACKEMGMQFAYHNHDFEFFVTDGQVPYDLLLGETDPDLVQMELDLYWVRKAEQNPLTYFAAHPGRFPLCHVKDMDNNGDITRVGQGVIDFGPIFAASEEAGLVHYFVEHDHPEDPMQSVTDGYVHLSTLQF